jgi:uroporphyrinogen III methyltransferase/synthase
LAISTPVHLMQILPPLDPAPQLPDPPVLVRPGEVWLVGAGPGDPGLLTRAGMAALLQADVVVHDRLGCEDIIAILPPAIRRIDVGKVPGASRWTQEAIEAVLLAEARDGQRVVRLKGGDPFVFGRGMEEALHLEAAGVPVRLVPGVSSALAGPALAGIAVTHRDMARAFRVATGRDRHGDVPEVPPEEETLVYLMGVSAMEELVARLVAQGRPETTPAAVVSRASTYRQTVVRGTLADIVARARAAAVEAPSLLVVGATAGGDAGVYTPRPALPAVVATSARLPRLLVARLGGRPVVHRPLAESAPLDGPPADWAGVLTADWIVVPSPPAAEGFLRELRRSGRDARAVRPRLAAIGEETVEVLARACLSADVAVVDGTQGGVAAAIGAALVGAHIVVVGAAGSTSTLPARLVAAGAARADRMAVYTRRARPAAEPHWPAVGAVFFASPSAVELMAAAWPAAPVATLEAWCVGESAARRAAEAGFGAVVDLAATTPADTQGEWEVALG